MKRRKRAIIIGLRELGYSYAEIAAIVGCAKSLAHYHGNGVVLSAQAAGRIRKKCTDIATATNKSRAGTNWISPQGLANLKESAIKCGKAARLKFGTEYFTDKMNLAYRKDELPIKAALESVLGQTFHKEKIGKRFFDFASDNYLIEFTLAVSGTYNILERFALAHKAGDRRKRIAFCPDQLVPKLLLSGMDTMKIAVFNSHNFKEQYLGVAQSG